MKNGKKYALLSCFLLVALPCIAVTVTIEKTAVRETEARQFAKALKTRDVGRVTEMLRHGLDPNRVLSDFEEDDAFTLFKYKLTGKEPDMGPTGGSSERTFEERYTGVGYAASYDDYAMAQLLLEHGASANPKDCYTDCTPLGIAAFQDHYPMCALLLSHGADPNGFCKGRGAMMCAKAWKDKRLVLLLKKYGAKDVP